MQLRVDPIASGRLVARVTDGELIASLIARARDNRLVILFLTLFALTPLLVPLL